MAGSARRLRPSLEAVRRSRKARHRRHPPPDRSCRAPRHDAQRSPASRAANVLQRAGRRLGFLTVRELLFHLPRRYDDLREMRQLGELRWVEEGDGRQRPRPGRRRPRRAARSAAASSGRSPVLEDETGSVEATWFGRRFIERRLFPGAEIIVSGKLKHFGRKLTLDNPDFQPVGARRRAAPRRADRAGLPADRRAHRRAAPDRDARGARPGRRPLRRVPARRRSATRSRSTGIAGALEEAHYPRSFEGRDAALRRLAFDELLALQLGMVGRRRQRGRDAARPIALDDAGDATLRASVIASIRREGRARRRPHADQDTAIAAIRADLARPTPMLRLLQGDVGSGKTAVAAWALAAAALNGRQGALLAPTDLLARQHHATLGRAARGRRHPGRAADRLADGCRGEPTLRDLVKSGQAPVVVGTHALIQERVEFAAPRRRRDRRAAPVRRRAARPARGEGRRQRPARPADDRDADPADPRPGPVRGSRRVRSPDAARGPDPDPDRDPPAGPARHRPGTGSARRRRPATARSSSCP